MGKKGGGGGETTQTQESSPWGPQQPYLIDGLQRAEDRYQSGPMSFYEGQTYADPSQQTAGAMSQLEGIANAGSVAGGAAQGLFGSTIAGDYLNANPYLDANYDRAAEAVKRNYQDVVQPGVDAGFSKGGRFGSRWHDKTMGTAQDKLGENLSGLANQMYGGNYATERANQQKMLNAAPMMTGFETLDSQRIGQVGAYQDMLNQRPIDEAMARHNFGQQENEAYLDRYLNRVNSTGAGYGTTTRTTDAGGSSGNAMMGLLGGAAGFGLGGGPHGAMLGYSIGNSL